MPWEVVHERMLAGLHQRGFEDLIAPHLTVLQYPGPDDMRPSDLAARTRMTKQALNYLLGQMEELGYVKRVQDRSDQRFRRIRLTERGRAAGLAMREIVSEVEAEWSRDLGARRFGQLRNLLAQLSDGSGSRISSSSANRGPVDADGTERENRARQPARKEIDVSWSLTGSYFETCSCELMCPCNMSFDHGATYDYCRVVLVFNIKEGEIEGTDVGGLKVAAIADTPKVMSEGNWRLGLFIDENAGDEQAEKLTAVFGGQKGGPMEAITPLVGEMLGVERVPFELAENGLSHSVKIGDAVDFEIEYIVPFGIDTGEPVRLVGMFHPVSSEFNAAEAKRSRISAFGIEYEGKTGISASEFAWAA